LLWKAEVVAHTGEDDHGEAGCHPARLGEARLGQLCRAGGQPPGAARREAATRHQMAQNIGNILMQWVEFSSEDVKHSPSFTDILLMKIKQERRSGTT